MDLLYHVLQALQLRNVGSGPTYVEFFSDNACQNASFVVRTDTNAADGPCGPITGDGVNSVNITMLYPGCTVTTYMGPWCTSNKTELFLGTCTSFPARSYSVDCPDINGHANENYTTISAASSSPSAGSLPSSTSETPTSFPQQDSTTEVEGASLSAIVTPSPTTSGKAASSTSTPFSSAATPSIQIPTSSTTGFQFPTSSPASSSLSSTSSSQANIESSKSGGNNQVKIIFPSVVIPLFIMFVIMYVLWRKESLRSRRGAIKGEEDREMSVDPRTLHRIEIQPSQEQEPADSTDVRTAPASDTESAHSKFSFLPKYPQADLQNRTAEACSP